MNQRILILKDVAYELRVNPQLILYHYKRGRIPIEYASANHLYLDVDKTREALKMCLTFKTRGTFSEKEQFDINEQNIH